MGAGFFNDLLSSEKSCDIVIRMLFYYRNIFESQRNITTS